MVTKDLVDFVKASKSEGKSDTDIKSLLREQKWQEKDIEQVFKVINPAVPTPTSVVPKPPESGSNPTWWDGFEHVLMFISLYFTAISFAFLLHAYVDKWAQSIDRATSYSRYAEGFSSFFILPALACLIVTFPLFAFFHIRVTKRTLKNPAVRHIKVRKFFIYMTLVVTFLNAISKIIHTVYNLLSGNFTTNFFLHVVVTLLITGTIFFYYVNQVKEDRKAYA